MYRYVQKEPLYIVLQYIEINDLIDLKMHVSISYQVAVGGEPGSSTGLSLMLQTFLTSAASYLRLHGDGQPL